MTKKFVATWADGTQSNYHSDVKDAVPTFICECGVHLDRADRVTVIGDESVEQPTGRTTICASCARVYYVAPGAMPVPLSPVEIGALAQSDPAFAKAFAFVLQSSPRAPGQNRPGRSVLDSLDNPVRISIRLRGLGVQVEVEVEQEIIDFLGEHTRRGDRIRDAGGKLETPSEWFVSRVTGFVRDATIAYIDQGVEATTAVTTAVLDACSYAAPSYYIGRALEISPKLEPAHRAALRSRLLNYLRRHPEQRARLADEDHVRAVPYLERPLRALLASAS